MSYMNIRSLRTGAGLSQTALARLVGVDQATSSRIERGLQTVSIKQVESIAAACGYEVRLVKASRKRKRAA